MVPSGVSTVWTEDTLAGDTPGRECPHDDVEIRPRMGTMRMSEDRVPSMNIESPYGGGVSSLPGATRSLLPVKFPAAPVLLADGPPLGSWQVAGQECPRAEQNRQRLIDVFEVTGNVRPVVPAGGSPLAGVVYPAGPDGPVVAGGPVGPCETSSPSSEEIQEPLEHAVLIRADPADQHVAVGTLSPSDCYPAGPAGPYVAGGPVGPDDCLQVQEPFEHLVLDHADPAGQHADLQDTVASLELAVVETILDGRLMEGITWPELLEHSLRLLDTTWMVDWLTRSQIGSRRQVRFRTLPWTVDLWRGLHTLSVRLWGCLWTVDSWRGCRVWNH